MKPHCFQKRPAREAVVERLRDSPGNWFEWYKRDVAAELSFKTRSCAEHFYSASERWMQQEVYRAHDCAPASRNVPVCNKNDLRARSFAGAFPLLAGSFVCRYGCAHYTDGRHEGGSWNLEADKLVTLSDNTIVEAQVGLSFNGEATF